ncbi:MAG: hypothetical protein ACU0BH_01945 [Paracoccaceae bacterium]|nr:hypothetical protein [Seohaeicola saemankumensis]MCD1627151.1 hypothetical protein [Seohaeicola saemankumensis]
MKNKRWMKSVIETAKSTTVAGTSLPWQRGGTRAAMIVKRHSPLKAVRSA